MKDLLKEADIISIHIPLTKETENLIGKSEFELMKNSSILINTSRGEVIDEDELLSCLHSGKILGAGLDVLRNENKSKNWLMAKKLWEYARNHSNLIITPHIGGATIDSMHKTELFLAKKLLGLLNDNVSFKKLSQDIKNL